MHFNRNRINHLWLKFFQSLQIKAVHSSAQKILSNEITLTCFQNEHILHYGTQMKMSTSDKAFMLKSPLHRWCDTAVFAASVVSVTQQEDQNENVPSLGGVSIEQLSSLCDFLLKPL